MSKIKTVKEFFRKHYYAVLIFAFIMIYSCMVPGEFKLWQADEAALAIHAVDFGLGFCSKLLPGALYNVFFDSVGPVKTYIYLSVLLTIFFAILSFILERFVLNVEVKHRKTAFVVTAFFLTGPSTFAIHVDYPGMLDMYWVFCGILLFVFLTKKQLTPLLFLPFVLCITVYFASLICFVPFFVIIVLYKISYSEIKKEKMQLLSILIVSTIAAVGLSVYFAVYETDNLVYTMEEFHKLYSSRGTDNFFYFDQSLYKDVYSNGLDSFAEYTLKTDSTIDRIFAEIILRINYNLYKISIKDKLVIISLISPIVIFILAFFFKQIRINFNKKNKFKLFLNLCTVAFPFFTIFLSVFFSEDITRWIGHAFLTLFALFIFILHNEGEEAWSFVEKYTSKISTSVLFLYFSFYATTVYEPYYIG